MRTLTRIHVLTVWSAVLTALVVACSGDEGDDDHTGSSSGAVASSSGTSGFDGSFSLGAGSDAKCDFPADVAQCTEWRGNKSPSWSVQKGTCESAQGTFTEDQTCATANRVGGCRSTFGDGSTQTNWYYQGSKYPDAASAQDECADDQTFVTE